MQNQLAASAPRTRLQRIVSRVLTAVFPELGAHFKLTVDNAAQFRKLADLILFSETRQLQAEHPNPLNKFGRKCFSQTDEDGITLEILKRIGALEGGSFVEFGVGDGTENNTLILASLGWKGFWIGERDLAFRYSLTDRFLYQNAWITLDNILGLAQKGLAHIQVNNPDVISIDLDGNDIYFVEKLLSGKLRPKLFIVEYNAKFPPPIEFQISYDPAHVWGQDDYFGASLCSFVKLFSAHRYRLVCCNSHTGSNAFFVVKSNTWPQSRMI